MRNPAVSTVGKSNQRLAAVMVCLIGLLAIWLLASEAPLAGLLAVVPALTAIVLAFLLERRGGGDQKASAVLYRGVRAIILLAGGFAMLVLLLVTLLGQPERGDDSTTGEADSATSNETSSAYSTCKERLEPGLQACLGMSDKEVVWESCRRSYLREMDSCTG